MVTNEVGCIKYEEADLYCKYPRLRERWGYEFLEGLFWQHSLVFLFPFSLCFVLSVGSILALQDSLQLDAMHLSQITVFYSQSQPQIPPGQRKGENVIAFRVVTSCPVIS